MITERVTNLESFHVCPFKFKHDKFDSNNPKIILATSIWDIIHIAHQYPAMAKILADNFFDNVYESLMWEKNNIKKKQVMNMIDLAWEWIEEFKDNEKYFEVKSKFMINWILTTWSYDCLVIEKDWTPHIFDFKTTNNKSFYWDDKRAEKFQIKMYAYYVMKSMWYKSIKVSYEVYVKAKKSSKASRLRVTKKFKLDDISELIESTCEDFALANDTWVYRTKPFNSDWKKTSHCWFCPMRNQESADAAWLPLCPNMADNTQIDWEISF